MAPSRRSSSGLAVAVSAAVCGLAGWSALDFVLAGSAAAPRAAKAPTTQRQVNIFEGLNFGPVGGEELNPEEVGTRSQRQADESRSRLVECSLPLGVEFEEKDGGDIYIKAVEQGTDAWEQGIRPGTQCVMLSATFGDEMWSARKVGMTQFLQTLNSRAGWSIRLALEKENQNFLGSFLESFSPKATPQDEKKQKDMAKEFEQEEARLEGKNFWNPFR